MAFGSVNIILHLLSFSAFSYMNDEELLFGISRKRILSITDRISLSMPVVDLEKPMIHSPAHEEQGGCIATIVVSNKN